MMDLRNQFREVFGSEPALASRAPGRVNLIGEHTDYNDGYVMPIAIQYATTILAAPRNDREIRIHSLDFHEETSFSLDRPIEKSRDRAWSNYQKAVLVEFLKRGDALSGADFLIQGNVPMGAGLSSSASVEMATAGAVRTLNRLFIHDVDLVKLCQRAENEFVGMKCGIMDQFISGMGQEGKVLFLDCRTLDYEIIRFPSDLYSVVILNTKVKRELAGSAYNERRGQCEEGVRLLKQYLPNIRALRDVSVSDFEGYAEYLPETVRKRCGHVVRENQRVLDFRDDLKKNRRENLGKLLLDSHESLRDLYEVSCPELDAMVDIAMKTDGVVGARMTGAGFGGCAIALIQIGKEKGLEKNVLEQYPEKTGITPEVYASSPSQGITVELYR
jgi:galactokinase